MIELREVRNSAVLFVMTYVLSSLQMSVQRDARSNVGECLPSLRVFSVVASWDGRIRQGAKR